MQERPAGTWLPPPERHREDSSAGAPLAQDLQGGAIARAVSRGYLSGMISQKMKYALKALLVLADEAASAVPEALTIEEVARRSGAPKRFLEHILLEIRNAGVIASTRGRSGGYHLIKQPSEVSISELLRLIDGPIAPLGCLSRRAYQRCDDCPDEAACRIRRVFADVFWSYLVLIESLTLADMLRSDAAAEQILNASIGA
jgi:Rrf2 family protein